MIERKNAIIKAVSLSIADHGCLSAWLTLDYGGTGQAFGGYALYLLPDCRHHELKSHAGHWIARCCQIAGVTKWEDIPGKTVRVECEHSKVHAIGHIVNDDWFNPSEDFAVDENGVAHL